MTSKSMMRALKKLNAYVDDDRQKLCDRLHELELSHKRQEKLLKRFLEVSGYFDFSFLPVFKKLHDDVKNELSYPYFRAHERRIK